MLPQVGVLSDYGALVGLASGPEPTQHSGTASDEDRITPATEEETRDEQTHAVVPLCKQENLLLACNSIGVNTDAVLRKVLKA